MNSNDSQQGQSDPYEDLAAEADVLAKTVAALRGLSATGRDRVLQTLTTFFGSPQARTGHVVGPSLEIALPRQAASFSEDRTLTPKAFMLDKKPVTDVERVTSLAYYLTHYREVSEFKTIDLSKLNTEAAQVKLSNPAVAVDNAVKAGFLVATSRGNKMISANGELYVQALPDRDAARAAVAHVRPRRKKRQRGSTDEAEQNG